MKNPTDICYNPQQLKSYPVEDLLYLVNQKAENGKIDVDDLNKIVFPYGLGKMVEEHGEDKVIEALKEKWTL